MVLHSKAGLPVTSATDLCSFCNAVENEKHVTYFRPIYKEIREQYLTGISTEVL